MAVPETFLRAEYALLHGEDSEGRRAALEAWKARHVDPEWADFSLLVCAEGCPWPEVQNALSESAPLGAVRVVVVPQAENLLEKPKELPPTIRALLERPLPDTRLLLVSRAPLSAGPGRTLGAKPFSEWVQQGRVLKVGALEEKEAQAYVESPGPGARAEAGRRRGGPDRRAAGGQPRDPAADPGSAGPAGREPAGDRGDGGPDHLPARGAERLRLVPGLAEGPDGPGPRHPEGRPWRTIPAGRP